MNYQVIIPGRLPSLNELIVEERKVCRTSGGRIVTGGAQMKKKWQRYIDGYIRTQLHGVHIEKPIIVHYHYFEPNHKRDFGNIHAVCQKFFEDSAQNVGLIVNDNQRCIKGFTADFDFDKDNPRIEITLEEIE